MAEAALTPYIFVIFAGLIFGLVLRILYQRRLVYEKRQHRVIIIKHENRYTIGVFIMFIGAFFLLGGILGLVNVGFWQEYLESVKDEKMLYQNNTEIDFIDHEAFKTWITSASISSTDSDPLTIEYERRLQATVESKELPKELVVHVFHEDMLDFFVNDKDPTAYRQQTTTLNKLLSLQYGPMFSIDFDLSNQSPCNNQNNSNEVCEYSFSAFDEWTFKTPGKYFVQFSAQLEDNSFDHRKSPLPLTTIMKPHDVWMEEKMKRLIILTEAEKIDTQRSLGWNFIGISLAMILAGMALGIPSIEIRHKFRDENQ